MSIIKHRGLELTTRNGKWFVCSKPFYLYKFKGNYTATTRLELIKLVDLELIKEGYL